jgi:hypothetical protein
MESMDGGAPQRRPPPPRGRLPDCRTPSPAPAQPRTAASHSPGRRTRRRDRPRAVAAAATLTLTTTGAEITAPDRSTRMAVWRGPLLGRPAPVGRGTLDRDAEDGPTPSQVPSGHSAIFGSAGWWGGGVTPTRRPSGRRRPVQAPYSRPASRAEVPVTPPSVSLPTLSSARGGRGRHRVRRQAGHRRPVGWRARRPPRGVRAGIRR